MPVCWPCPPVCSHQLGRHRKQLSPHSDHRHCRTASPEGRKLRIGQDSPGFLPKQSAFAQPTKKDAHCEWEKHLEFMGHGHRGRTWDLLWGFTNGSLPRPSLSRGRAECQSGSLRSEWLQNARVCPDRAKVLPDCLGHSIRCQEDHALVIKICIQSPPGPWTEFRMEIATLQLRYTQRDRQNHSGRTNLRNRNQHSVSQTPYSITPPTQHGREITTTGKGENKKLKNSDP